MKNKRKLLSFEALILSKFLLLLLVLPTNAESALENQILLLKQEEQENEQNKKESLFANVKVQVNQEFSQRQADMRSALYRTVFSQTLRPQGSTATTPDSHDTICHVNKDQEEQMVDLEKEIKSLLTRSEFYDFLRNDFGNSCPKKKLLYRQKILVKIK